MVSLGCVESHSLHRFLGLSEFSGPMTHLTLGVWECKERVRVQELIEALRAHMALIKLRSPTMSSSHFWLTGDTSS